MTDERLSAAVSGSDLTERSWPRPAHFDRRLHSKAEFKKLSVGSSRSKEAS